MVALRKESVDRNNGHGNNVKHFARSLSARRAWIEMIFQLVMIKKPHFVALRKESVDRNTLTGRLRPVLNCRSPQGERG